MCCAMCCHPSATFSRPANYDRQRRTPTVYAKTVISKTLLVRPPGVCWKAFMFCSWTFLTSDLQPPRQFNAAQWWADANRDWDLSRDLSHFGDSIWDVCHWKIWDLRRKLDLRLAKWFKSIYWKICDLTIRFDLGFSHHWRPGVPWEVYVVGS